MKSYSTHIHIFKTLQYTYMKRYSVQKILYSKTYFRQMKMISGKISELWEKRCNRKAGKFKDKNKLLLNKSILIIKYEVVFGDY
jgi:hypothetical protein